MSEYRFERLSKNNLKDLITLYNAAFNEKADIVFLEKKFDTSFAGLSYVGFLAYHATSNRPAAYYGVFPVIVRFQGNVFLAAQSGDTMTHPDHRGKGLFISLAKMTYNLAKENAVEFIFGFPNQNSYPGFVKKLDWKHYANINNYKVKAGSVPLEKVAKKSSIFRSVYSAFFLRKLNNLATRQTFPNSLNQQTSGLGSVEHDEKFFKYKGYYNSYVIEIEGVKCWLKIDGRMWIGDIEYCEKNIFLKVIDGLIRLSKKLWCSTIHFSVFENSKYDIWLKEKFKLASQNPVGALALSGKTDPASFAYQAADMDTF